MIDESNEFINIHIAEELNIVTRESEEKYGYRDQIDHGMRAMSLIQNNNKIRGKNNENWQILLKRSTFQVLQNKTNLFPKLWEIDEKQNYCQQM